MGEETKNDISPLLYEEFQDSDMKQNAEEAFCEKTCQEYFGIWFCCTLIFLVAAFFLFLLSPILGMVIASVVPSSIILFITRRVFKDHILVGQMIATFFEAIMWMIPLLCLDILGMDIINDLYQSTSITATVLKILVVSLFFAGFCEEMLVRFL